MGLVIGHCDYCGAQLSQRVGEEKTFINVEINEGVLKRCGECNHTYPLLRATWAFDSTECFWKFLKEKCPPFLQMKEIAP